MIGRSTKKITYIPTLIPERESERERENKQTKTYNDDHTLLVALLDIRTLSPGCVAGMGEGEIAHAQLIEGAQHRQTTTKAVATLHSNQRSYSALLVCLHYFYKNQTEILLARREKKKDRSDLTFFFWLIKRERFSFSSGLFFQDEWFDDEYWCVCVFFFSRRT